MNTNFGKFLPKLNGFGKAALVLGVILSLALSQLAPAKGQASKPTGVLTFSNLTNFFDYNIKSGEMTDYGKGENAFRADNGYALVRDSDYNLILVSPDGRKRPIVVTAKTYSSSMEGFILSPNGKTIVYDQISNDPRFSTVLVTHNVQTGDEETHGYSDADHLVPQGWMPDGRLLAMPSYGHQKGLSDKGEIAPLNFVIINKDSIGAAAYLIDQPSTKPVENISDLRMEPTGKRISGNRIAFTWDGHVWIANSDGSGAKQITKSEGGQVGEGQPAWSPNGSWLAVKHYDGLVGSIYLVPIDGKVHGMNDKNVIKLLDKTGLSSGVKDSGLTCIGRITWR